MKRKGQTALEFLITYGWAFLVILIMIGALTYFGVLTPNILEIKEQTEFQCLYQFEDANVTLNLTNSCESYDANYCIYKEVNGGYFEFCHDAIFLGELYDEPN